MGQEIIWAIKPLLLPPGGILTIGLIALLVGRGQLRKLLLATAFISLYLVSTPFIANLLMQQVERYPALSNQELATSDAEAIVVLGGGRRHAVEYGGDTLSALTLERVRYAAYLAGKTQLPIIPSGGQHQPDQISEAQLAKEVLEREFMIPVESIEDRSRTTWENAQMTARLLQDRGIDKVYLVTHAMHMPRSVQAFQGAGVNVIAAPTVFFHVDDDEVEIFDWFPQSKAIRTSYFALHELIGDLWYQLRQHWEQI